MSETVSPTLEPDPYGIPTENILHIFLRCTDDEYIESQISTVTRIINIDVNYVNQISFL